MLLLAACADPGTPAPSVAGRADALIGDGPMRIVAMNMGHLEYGALVQNAAHLPNATPNGLHQLAADFLAEQAPENGGIVYSLQEVDYGHFPRTSNGDLPFAFEQVVGWLAGTSLHRDFAPVIQYAEVAGRIAPYGESHPRTGNLVLTNYQVTTQAPEALWPVEAASSPSFPHYPRHVSIVELTDAPFPVWHVSVHSSPCRIVNGVPQPSYASWHLRYVLGVLANLPNADAIILSGDLNVPLGDDECPAIDGPWFPGTAAERLRADLAEHSFVVHGAVGKTYVAIRDPGLHITRTESRHVATSHQTSWTTGPVSVSDHGDALVVDIDFSDTEGGNAQLLPAIIRL